MTQTIETTTHSPTDKGPWSPFLSPWANHWVCARCFSTQADADPCHCGWLPAQELTAHGPRLHVVARDVLINHLLGSEYRRVLYQAIAAQAAARPDQRALHQAALTLLETTYPDITKHTGYRHQ